MKKILFLAAALLLAAGCSNNEGLEFSPKSIIKEADTYAFSGTYISTNAKDATFTVEDDFYASVRGADSYANVFALKIGETRIHIKSSLGEGYIPITITPRCTHIPELDQLIGKSRSEIVSVLGNADQTTISNGGNSLDLYNYENEDPSQIRVAFNSKGNKCTHIAVRCSITSVPTITYLLERYAWIDDYHHFQTHDGDVYIYFGNSIAYGRSWDIQEMSDALSTSDWTLK